MQTMCSARITSTATINSARGVPLTRVTLAWDDPSLRITDFDILALGGVIEWDKHSVLVGGPCLLEAGSEIPFQEVHPDADEALKAALRIK